MNKRFVKTLLLIWICIAVLLTGILVYAIAYGHPEKKFFRTFTWGGSANMIQKDEKVSLDNCNKINFDFTSTDIIVQTTDDTKLRVIQSSSAKLTDDQKFTISKDGDTILVSTRERTHIFSFGSWNEKIEIYIPQSYTKDLDIRSSSGNITFNSDIILNNLACTLSSGNLHIYSNIDANEVNMKCGSGNIDIEGLKCSTYEINTSSGNIGIDSLSGSGEVSASSGNIKIDYKDIKDYSNITAHSGNITLTVPKQISFEFDGECTSGDIDSNFDLNYKNKRGNKASGKIGDGPYKKINARTTSGNIRISSR